jgi:hypothetical protein
MPKEVNELIKAAAQNVSSSESEAIELANIFKKTYKYLGKDDMKNFLDTLRKMNEL